MFIRTQENYREVSKSILGLATDLRIFTFTLFNILVGTYLEREIYKCSNNPETRFHRVRHENIHNFLKISTKTVYYEKS